MHKHTCVYIDNNSNKFFFHISALRNDTTLLLLRYFAFFTAAISLYSKICRIAQKEI